MLLLILGALAWTPSEGEAAMIRALSARDGAPPCEQVEAHSPDPAASLASIVAHVQLPPWAPMHAAACLIERHAPARPELLAAWVADPQARGLARLVFHRLHLLPPTQAADLGSRALRGPLAADARRLMRASPSLDVQALATAP